MNLDKIFHLKENNTNVKTEILAGVTTFMTMAYILAVNPNILAEAGMDQSGLHSDSSGSVHRYVMYGNLCKLSVCTGAGNGTECVLCIHGCTPDGVFLEGRAGSSTGRGYYLYSVITAECARGNL